MRLIKGVRIPGGDSEALSGEGAAWARVGRELRKDRPQEDAPNSGSVGAVAEGKAALLVQHKVQPDETFDRLRPIEGFEEPRQDAGNGKEVTIRAAVAVTTGTHEAVPSRTNTEGRGHPGTVCCGGHGNGDHERTRSLKRGAG